MTKQEIMEAMGLEYDETFKIYSYTPQTSNPYIEIGDYATADCQMAKVVDVFYVATKGVINSENATEVV